MGAQHFCTIKIKILKFIISYIYKKNKNKKIKNLSSPCPLVFFLGDNVFNIKLNIFKKNNFLYTLLYTNFGFILFFSHSELFLVIFNRFYSSLL
jgi:hypothetical protein